MRLYQYLRPRALGFRRHGRRHQNRKGRLDWQQRRANPERLIAFQGELYFTAPKPSGAYSLWKTDGSEAGTIELSDPDLNGARNPRELVVVGNSLFFSARQGNEGYELWKSDGTAAGTVLVKDVQLGVEGSSPLKMTNVGGILYFTADDDVHGRELWRSDGTEAGTYLLRDVRIGSEAGGIDQLTAAGGLLYFWADDSTHGRELWRSNGTIDGTYMAFDQTPGGNGSNIEWIRSGGDRLYYSMHTPQFGTELWSLELSHPTGDYDGDFVVDGADFLAWQRSFGAAVEPAGSGADGNGDGAVDGDDLDVWQDYFGQPPATITGLSAAATTLASADDSGSAFDESITAKFESVTTTLQSSVQFSGVAALDLDGRRLTAAFAKTEPCSVASRIPHAERHPTLKQAMTQSSALPLRPSTTRILGAIDEYDHSTLAQDAALEEIAETAGWSIRKL